MRILEAEGPQGIYAVIVGSEEWSSTFFIPPEGNPQEKVIELTLDKTPGAVPISRFQVSLLDCLALIEQMYGGLIKDGWKPRFARQILPSGA